MKTQLIFIFSIVVWFSSCKRYYTANDFEEISKNHKTVAVLPFEVITTGHVPEELTSEMIVEIEENESKAFQVSFYNSILSSTKRGKKNLRINLQHYAKTVERLEESEVSIRDSWSKDPSKLAKILGVDAVVTGRIKKHKYFSDGVSVGIEVGTNILTEVFGDTGVVPAVSNRNKNVNTNYSLVNSSDGTVLWSIGYNHEADWRQHQNQLVSNINNRSAKHFPYRVRD